MDEEFSVDGGNRCVGCATLAAFLVIVGLVVAVAMALGKA